MSERQDDTFEYDVCLSFAGEQRVYVRQVAQLLQGRGVSVFFDEYEEADMWGKDLYEHLAIIYSQRAQYCILFASKEYAEKVWPSHERANAQARALETKGEYILPARFDDTDIPGLRKTIGYIDLTKKTPEQLAELFIQKVNPGGGTVDDLGQIISNRFDAEWQEDQDLFERIRHQPRLEDFDKALRRAGHLGLISSHGLRVPIVDTSAYLRVPHPDTWNTDSSVKLYIESKNIESVAVCEWRQPMTVADIAFDIASKLRNTHYWEGEQNYFPESVFDGFASVLQFGLSAVRKGQQGFLGFVFEVVGDDWLVTEWWLIDTTHHYQIPYGRFNEDDWIPHVTQKLWVDRAYFLRAFEVATSLIEKGIFEGRLPTPKKP
jgi:hypothetical protein